MEAHNEGDLGTMILPIPPALEFPSSRSDFETPYEPKTPPAFPRRRATLSPSNISSSEKKPGLGIRRIWTASGQCKATAWNFDETSDSSSSEERTKQIRRTNSRTNPKGAEKTQNSKPSTSHFSRFSIGNDDFNTSGNVSKTSGRLDITVNELSNHGYLAKALGTTLQHHLKPNRKLGDHDDQHDLSSPVPEETSSRSDIGARLSTLGVIKSVKEGSVPFLNIVIMVIGSRGDIQPFLKIGKLLKEYGHRVRIATHPAFKTFVEQDINLEFFSVGGDPASLMAFMVKNPGLMPSASTIRAGEVGKKREAMFGMFKGFWRACINATDEEDDPSNLRMMGGKHPFVADAIIANPPSFAHIHCAERLGIPLHLMFTFPYSPTQQFPHPLANIKQSNIDANYTNFMSYPLVEMMTWQGLGDLVNRFRVETLGLESVSTLWAPGQLFRLRVPYTYLWSPGLIPKPADWGPEIDLAGFVFLDLASSFKPPQSLLDFLQAGDPPVYIGFGSIVVDDPDKFTSLIFKAVAKAGVRALVSKGWGGLGEKGNSPDNIFMLENTPHDWLFSHVSAVVHHGGAGTTAIGLKHGKPTMIVPFFGDQPFWGAMVAKAGAGAHEPIPYKKLSVDAFAQGIKECLMPEAKIAAEKMAQDIALEGDGASNAVESFHSQLPMRGEHSMRCSILQDRVAVWEVKDRSAFRLSTLAAEILVEKRKLRWNELRLRRHRDWNDFAGPGEPLTGGGAALLHSVGDVVKGIGGVPLRWSKRARRKTKGTREVKDHSDRVSKKGSASNPSSPTDDTSEARAGDDRSKGLTHRHRHHVQKSNPIPQPNLAGPHVNEKPLADENNLKSTPKNYHDNEAKREPSVSTASQDSRDHVAQDVVFDAGAGLVKAGEAIAKIPMDLAIAVAQGFHNAPRLYGDSTVRPSLRISGIHSGLRAAGEEFILGIYDGVTGLVIQPYQGAKDGGALGLIQGFGKGVGGFILKDIAAVIGPIGYTLKGVHKELIKDKQPTAFIRRARIVQGRKDMKTLTAEDETKVDAAWKVVVEIWNEVERAKKEGLLSRLRIEQARRRLLREGAFESIETTNLAFQQWMKEKEEAERRRIERSKSRGGGRTSSRSRDGARRRLSKRRKEDDVDTEANGRGGAPKKAPPQPGVPDSHLSSQANGHSRPTAGKDPGSNIAET